MSVNIILTKCHQNNPTHFDRNGFLRVINHFTVYTCFQDSVKKTFRFLGEKMKKEWWDELLKTGHVEGISNYIIIQLVPLYKGNNMFNFEMMFVY